MFVLQIFSLAYTIVRVYIKVWNTSLTSTVIYIFMWPLLKMFQLIFSLCSTKLQGFEDMFKFEILREDLKVFLPKLEYGFCNEIIINPNE